MSLRLRGPNKIMAEIEASLLAKVQSAASVYGQPVLIGFLRSRKKRIGTLIEATSGQSLKELKREIKKKGGKKLKVYKEISTIYAEMPVDNVESLSSVSCAQHVYDAEGDVRLSLYESVPLIMGGERYELPYRVKGHKIEGRGVKVAVIDSGFDKDHPDFGWRVKASKNFSGGRASKGREHGTHVAGIIAGSGKVSGYRHAGVAPKATLYDAKVFMNAETPTTRDTIIDAVLWAVKKHVDVINMSFGDNHGCTDGTCLLCKTANYAVSKGITVVAAAGNVGPAEGTISCPGNAKDVITVGASTKTSPPVVMGFSSRGSSRQPDKPDVVAPGNNIMAPQPGGLYASMSGTSMAAPHVSGLAALLHQSKHYTTGGHHISPAQIKHTLQQNSVDLGEHKTAQGSGLVNFNNSLVSLRNVKKRVWRDSRAHAAKQRRTYIFQASDLKKFQEDNALPAEMLETLNRKLLHRTFTGEKKLRNALRNVLGQEACDAHYEKILHGISQIEKRKPYWFTTAEQDEAPHIEDVSTCPAAMKRFCPHYHSQSCNHVYESCIHYQQSMYTKVLQTIKE